MFWHGALTAAVIDGSFFPYGLIPCAGAWGPDHRLETGATPYWCYTVLVLQPMNPWLISIGLFHLASAKMMPLCGDVRKRENGLSHPVRIAGPAAFSFYVFKACGINDRDTFWSWRNYEQAEVAISSVVIRLLRIQYTMQHSPTIARLIPPMRNM